MALKKYFETARFSPHPVTARAYIAGSGPGGEVIPPLVTDSVSIGQLECITSLHHETRYNVLTASDMGSQKKQLDRKVVVVAGKQVVCLYQLRASC